MAKCTAKCTNRSETDRLNVAAAFGELEYYLRANELNITVKAYKDDAEMSPTGDLNDYSYAIALFKSDEEVGTISFSRSEHSIVKQCTRTSTLSEEPTGHISWLGVNDTHQGCGHSITLLLYAMLFMIKTYTDIDYFTLEDCSDNVKSCRNCYDTMGFSLAGVIDMPRVFEQGQSILQIDSADRQTSINSFIQCIMRKVLHKILKPRASRSQSVKRNTRESRRFNPTSSRARSADSYPLGKGKSRKGKSRRFRPMSNTRNADSYPLGKGKSRKHRRKG